MAKMKPRTAMKEPKTLRWPHLVRVKVGVKGGGG